MANDWPRTPLEELTEVESPITYGVVKPGDAPIDGVMLVRGGDIKHGKIDLASLRTITPELSQQYRRTILRGGELVVSLVGDPGEVAIVPPSLAGANVNRAVGLVRLRADVNAKFVKYFLRSEVGRRSILSLALGSVQQVVNLRDLKRVRVPRPGRGVEDAIAHILGTLDDKIELNRRIGETLEAMARALFRSWFVDFDPVRAKAEGRDTGLPDALSDLFPSAFADSELGEIPEGWEVKGLDQVARFLNGLALQKHPPIDPARFLPVIKIAELRSGGTNGADRASADIAPEYVVADGDILFSWSGSLECVLWAGGQGALNQHLFKVTSTEYPKWLSYFGVHRHLDEFRRIAAGKATTMGHIQRHHLSAAKLVVPSTPLLDAVDAVFSPMLESMWKRQVQSRTLASLRDTLLPRLISGELRVRDAGRILARTGYQRRDLTGGWNS